MRRSELATMPIAVAAIVVAAVVLVACGASTPTHATTRRAPTARTTAPTTVATTTTATRPTTTAARAPATTSTTRAPATTATGAATTTVPTTARRALEQRIVVSATGSGQNVATFSAYARTTIGWRLVFGPWTAHIGRNGFAPAGAKREGDGRTPSGTYGFDFFFGIDPDPGVHFPYRRITSPAMVWDDDPASPSYNEWIDTRVADAGGNPEPMDNPPVYDYGAVIAYNTAARTPGLGSAIFLHVSSGSSTAGCVSLPTSELLSVLRWLDPALAPTIAMGVGVAAP